MKINVNNVSKLAEAIKQAQGRETARAIDAERISNILNIVGDGIPKARLDGTKVFYDGAENYMNMPSRCCAESTYFSACNIKGRWYVTDIHRDVCPNKISNIRIEYSDAAKEQILQNASVRCI